MIKKSYVITFVAVIAVLVCAMLIMDKREQDRQAEHMKELQKEARQYEREITQIRMDLDEKRDMISGTPDKSGVIIGFVPASADDVDTIQQLTDGKACSPLIILDCSMEEDTLTSTAVKAAEEGYEIALAGITYDETVLNHADFMKTVLSEQGYEKDPVFLLRRPSDTTENRDELIRHGYRKMIRYNDLLIAGTDESGVCYLSYGFIRSSGSYSSVISQIEAAHSYTVMAIDFSDVHSGSIGENDIASILETTEKRVLAGALKFIGANESFHEIEESNRLAKLREKEYETYEKEQLARIEELKTIISEIYDRWNQY